MNRGPSAFAAVSPGRRRPSRCRHQRLMRGCKPKPSKIPRGSDFPFFDGRYRMSEAVTHRMTSQFSPATFRISRELWKVFGPRPLSGAKLGRTWADGIFGGLGLQPQDRAGGLSGISSNGRARARLLACNKTLHVSRAHPCRIAGRTPDASVPCRHQSAPELGMRGRVRILGRADL